VANQKEFFGECFKGDKTFPLIILLAKWVYQLASILYIKANMVSVRLSVWTKIGQCLEDFFSHCPFPVECFGRWGKGEPGEAWGWGGQQGGVSTSGEGSGGGASTGGRGAQVGKDRAERRVSTD